MTLIIESLQQNDDIISIILCLGSLSAFFLPMIVMVNSYILTVRLLRRKAKFYQESCHNYSTSSGKESSDCNSSNKNPSGSPKFYTFLHFIFSPF